MTQDCEPRIGDRVEVVGGADDGKRGHYEGFRRDALSGWHLVYLDETMDISDEPVGCDSVKVIRRA